MKEKLSNSYADDEVAITQSYTKRKKTLLVAAVILTGMKA